MPEISVRRDVGPLESERGSEEGSGAESFYRVIAIAVTDDGFPTQAREEGREEAPEEELGDEDLKRLELSLPQPTSRDIVIIHLVKPVYPRSSIDAGIEGVATFRVHVSKAGDVAAVWLLGSEIDNAAERSAEHALRQWKFRPYLVEGVATDILVDQRIRFRLTDGLTRPEGETRSN